eukprot:scaffold293043_cov71-Attheya_sp.AAC.2
MSLANSEWNGSLYQPSTLIIEWRPFSSSLRTKVGRTRMAGILHEAENLANASRYPYSQLCQIQQQCHVKWLLSQKTTREGVQHHNAKYIRHPSCVSHHTIIPAAFRGLVSAFVISAYSALSLAAVGGDSTVATTSSTTYHTLADASANMVSTLPNNASQCMLLHHTVSTSPSSSYPSIISGNQARFYTYQPQPMGSNLSVLAWQSHLGHATTSPPLTADLKGYNSDNSAATNDMPSLSYPT